MHKYLFRELFLFICSNGLPAYQLSVFLSPSHRLIPPQAVGARIAYSESDMAGEMAGARLSHVRKSRDDFSCLDVLNLAFTQWPKHQCFVMNPVMHREVPRENSTLNHVRCIFNDETFGAVAWNTVNQRQTLL